MRYRSVILDVDSTLCAIEGIDWLAAQRGAEVAARIAAVTERAMNGELPLEAVYGQRLALVDPDATLLHRLAEHYLETITPGAEAAVRAMREAGVELAIVSGGIRQCLMPLAERLGVPDERLMAVSVYLDEDGLYSAFDDRSPLATDIGKEWAARQLALPGPVLGVGDGATDLAMRPAVDAFAAFAAHARRDHVVAAADHVVESFEQLTSLVLS
ncbi:MAG: HAD-IB family phosphatase [Gemmatimonadaceae bacterium]|nr:HAD-IB family phosphatase [Gemmatimonadaceae bacterium]